MGGRRIAGACVDVQDVKGVDPLPRHRDGTDP